MTNKYLGPAIRHCTVCESEVELDFWGYYHYVGRMKDKDKDIYIYCGNPRCKEVYEINPLAYENRLTTARAELASLEHQLEQSKGFVSRS